MSGHREQRDCEPVFDAPPHTPPQEAATPPVNGESMPVGLVPPGCPLAPATSVDDEVATPGPDNSEDVQLGQVQVHDDGQGGLSMAPQGLKRGMAEALGDDSNKGGRTSPVAPHTTANVVDEEDDDEGGGDGQASGDE